MSKNKNHVIFARKVYLRNSSADEHWQNICQDKRIKNIFREKWFLAHTNKSHGIVHWIAPLLF